MGGALNSQAAPVGPLWLKLFAIRVPEGICVLITLTEPYLRTSEPITFRLGYMCEERCCDVPVLSELHLYGPWHTSASELLLPSLAWFLLSTASTLKVSSSPTPERVGLPLNHCDPFNIRASYIQQPTCYPQWSCFRHSITKAHGTFVDPGKEKRYKEKL